MFDVAEAVAPQCPPPLSEWPERQPSRARAAEALAGDEPPSSQKAAASADDARAQTARRNQRRKAFRREQAIVDHLNRGVSLPELAARLEVDERRLGDDIRDLLARRRPQTAEDFAAVQASRLNGALRVAYAAMTDSNLKAVDRVLRIVRALDRYHGFSPASLPRLKTEAEMAVASAAPGVTAAGLSPGGETSLGPAAAFGGDVGFDAKPFEAALAALSEAFEPSAASPADGRASDDAAACDRGPSGGAPADGRRIRDFVSQVLENMDSATDVGADPPPEVLDAAGSEAREEVPRGAAPSRASGTASGARPVASAGDDSSRISAQAFEKARFTPGFADPAPQVGPAASRRGPPAEAHARPSRRPNRRERRAATARSRRPS